MGGTVNSGGNSSTAAGGTVSAAGSAASGGIAGGQAGAPAVGAGGAGNVAGAAGSPGMLTMNEYPGIPDLQPVAHPAKPLYAPIWSPLYELQGNTIFPGSPYVETSLFEPYSDMTPGWWFNLLEEFRYAGIQNSLVLTRAAVSESAQWTTLKASLFSDMKTLSEYGQLKFGEFEDCGAWQGTFKALTGKTDIDWSDTTTMNQIFWDLMLKRFFDAVPKELWLRFNGHPLWVGWGSGGINTQGNISKALRQAKASFKAAYGEDLFMIVNQSWPKADTTVTPAEADAVQSWFCCGDAGSFKSWNNYLIGVGVPGFQIFNADGTPAPHAATFDRDHGNK
ncbi:MAG TPA: DUF5010 domain-containing protein, partial [Polyangiaceae bacterium]|nr:DUF5010 domain-containing protein [Polyangiaceae bacterium]